MKRTRGRPTADPADDRRICSALYNLLVFGVPPKRAYPLVALLVGGRNADAVVADRACREEWAPAVRGAAQMLNGLSRWRFGSKDALLTREAIIEAWDRVHRREQDQMQLEYRAIGMEPRLDENGGPVKPERWDSPYAAVVKSWRWMEKHQMDPQKRWRPPRGAGRTKAERDADVWVSHGETPYVDEPGRPKIR